MSDDLKALVEKARHYRMTPQERDAQVISFAYGNGHIEDARVTREGVTRALINMGHNLGVIPTKQ
jgi:hypothetical protein